MQQLVESFARIVVGCNDHLRLHSYSHYIGHVRKAASGFAPVIALDRASSEPLQKQLYAQSTGGAESSIQSRPRRRLARFPHPVHLTVTLPKGMRDRPLSQQAARQDLWLWPLSSCYHAKPASQGFILGFGTTPVSEILKAVSLLRQIVRPQQ